MRLNCRKNLHHKYRRIKKLKYSKKKLLLKQKKQQKQQKNYYFYNLNKYNANIEALPSTSFLTEFDKNYLKTNNHLLNIQKILKLNNFNYNLIKTLTKQYNYQIINNNNKHQKLLNKTVKSFKKKNYFKTLKNNYRIANNIKNNTNANNNKKIFKQKICLKNLIYLPMYFFIFNKCNNIFKYNKNNIFIKKYLNNKILYKINKCTKFSFSLFNIKRFAFLFFAFLSIFITAVSSNWNDDIQPNTTYISQVQINEEKTK